MWTIQPLEHQDLLDFCQIACGVMRTRVPGIFSDDLEIDVQLGSRSSTIELQLDNLGPWVAAALRRAGLVTAGRMVGRWPAPVRAAAAALLAAVPWSIDELIEQAPGSASDLLEALRGYEDLAELVTPPDLVKMRQPGGWRVWSDQQEAIILAARG